MEFDEDTCEVCQQYGELVVCDRCAGTWHRACHQIPITDDEMVEGVEWFCHRCRDHHSVERASPILTNTGHLRGCLGQHIPNLLAPRCRHAGCGHLASKQSCVWRERGVLYCWCPNHWRKHCMSVGFDADLSQCANIMANRRGFSMKDRINTDDLNIEERLGLPTFYRGSPTNHVSDYRQRQARFTQRAERARDDRRRIALLTQQYNLDNQLRWARARANVGVVSEESSDDSEDSSFDSQDDSEEHSNDAQDDSEEYSDDAQDDSSRKRIWIEISSEEDEPPRKKRRL